MSDLIKIAVDAMGGDGSPKKIIDGIILNHSTNKNNFFKIFGDKNKIDPIINGKIPTEFFELIQLLSIFDCSLLSSTIFLVENFIV